MWSIGVVVNTVEITKECAKELFEAQDNEQDDEEYIWSEPENVAYKGKLCFNPDHMEHMDFLATDEKIVEILKKHKVAGDICFGSLEGDNKGQFWGYRFDGKGGMTELKGLVVYEENHTPLTGMVFVITGTLSGMTREEAHRNIQELGGEVSDFVSSKISYLIVGEKPGSKLAKAEKLGIKILNEKDFSAMLRSTNADTKTPGPKTMSAEDREAILEYVESEGFDYAMQEYGNTVKDKTFRELRKVYLDARKALAKYVGHKD